MRCDSDTERTFTADDFAELCGLPVSVVKRWVASWIWRAICRR